MVHFFIFWTTKTGIKPQSEAHHWWHPGERLGQASCLGGGAGMMASVSEVLMWGSWIIHKHVWCCQVTVICLSIVRGKSQCLNMLHTSICSLSKTLFPMAESCQHINWPGVRRCDSRQNLNFSLKLPFSFFTQLLLALFVLRSTLLQCLSGETVWKCML